MPTVVCKTGVILMKRFWNIFWKVFGIAVVAIFAAAGIIGLITQSASLAYIIIQRTFIVALAVCGTIGLFVPVGLYFGDRNARRSNRAVE
jgi:uncharacterized membrane protein YraQ (UPF0718 family)